MSTFERVRRFVRGREKLSDQDRISLENQIVGYIAEMELPATSRERAKELLREVKGLAERLGITYEAAAALGK